MFFWDEDLGTECYFKKAGLEDVCEMIWSEMIWCVFAFRLVSCECWSSCTHIFNHNVRLMEEIPVDMVNIPWNYRVLYIPRGARFLRSVSCQACEGYDFSKCCSTLIVPALVGQDAVISSRNDEEAFCAIPGSEISHSPRLDSLLTRLGFCVWCFVFSFL